MTKRIRIFAVILLLLFSLALPTFAAAPRVVDQADLLTDGEEAALAQRLDAISGELNFDFVVVTADDLGGSTTQDYADDYFDYNGYGVGEGRDGALLLVDMENRIVWLSTSGYGITAFTDAGIEYITDSVAEYLGDEEYDEALSLFADYGKDFVEKARAGEPYDSGNLPKAPFNVGMTLVISVGLGLIVGWIVTGSMKSKLKSVRRQQRAAEYQRPGSMNVTQSGDYFLYSTVACQEIQQESSGGGSSTHTSSSGRTHGGGGSSF